MRACVCACDTNNVMNSKNIIDKFDRRISRRRRQLLKKTMITSMLCKVIIIIQECRKCQLYMEEIICLSNLIENSFLLIDVNINNNEKRKKKLKINKLRLERNDEFSMLLERKNGLVCGTRLLRI